MNISIWKSLEHFDIAITFKRMIIFLVIDFCSILQMLLSIMD